MKSNKILTKLITTVYKTNDLNNEYVNFRKDISDNVE